MSKKTHYIIYFILLIINCNNFYSQNNSQEISSNPYSISFGWANPVSFFTIESDSNLSYFIDFTSNIDSIRFFKFHMKSSLNYNSPILLMQNFLISVGNGKILKKKEKTYNWGFGKDAYFKMNLRRFKVAKGSRSLWESELYGFGLQFYTFYDWHLKNNWWLNATCYLNLGLNQEYISSSINTNNAQEIWRFRLGANQLLNFGIKKTF